MSKARPKTSTTDQHARKIATEIAKGRMPALSPDLEQYLAESPREIFAAFNGAARHMPPGGQDEALAFGYLFLLQGLLEHLRYRIDRGYAGATDLIQQFQADVASRIEAGEVGRHMLGYVAGALHQSKIPALPELSAAMAIRPAGEETDLPADMSQALDGLLESCDGDPFAFAASLAEFGHALPEEGRCALACSLALGGRSDARAAATMFLLDSSAEVRRAVAGALARAASSLSPVDLRRLIAMRNWRPESERAEIDTIIRNARTAGIECARWDAGSIETALGTAIDGAGTQSFMLISPAGRKKRISSILIKDGVDDAWCGPPETARRIETTIASAGIDLPMLAISRPYLDRVLSHALALTTEQGQAAPLGLLEVAETIGGADWQPARIDFAAALVADLPKAVFDPMAVADVLRNSGELTDLYPLERSWFEDDPEIAQVVAGGHGRGRAKLVSYLLQSAFARRRNKWADIFLRTALWMREAPPADELCWRELTLVAKALADGRDLTEIGLMRDIAERTIAVLASEARRRT
ncbi:MAG TPA: hypothetical protein VMM15_36630 [Bradyrhizobium sp.]|nr:hypothetical protein [Bradyrhizobium sp.]